MSIMIDSTRYLMLTAIQTYLSVLILMSSSDAITGVFHDSLLIKRIDLKLRHS